MNASNKLSFNYNPFGGLTDEELMQVIVPRESVGQILEDIKSEQPLMIELVGKKGRGKTSHLKLLHRLHGAGKLYELTAREKPFELMMQDSAEVLFIDSIHHLNLRKRLKLFKCKKKIVLTAHHSRFLEFKWSNLAYKTYPFKGIEKKQLIQLLQNRLALASKHQAEVTLDEEEVTQLITKYKDDYRAILKSLYTKYNA
ncbi:MAG: hypothetical protein AB8G15_12470 [Saprospiraceae bacterium]